MSLSLVSRIFNTIARPILRREIHITRAWHLPALLSIRDRDRDHARRNEVELLSLAVNVDALAFREGVWFGRFFYPVLHWLFTADRPHQHRLRRLYLNICPTEEGICPTRADFVRVTGMDEGWPACWSMIGQRAWKVDQLYIKTPEDNGHGGYRGQAIAEAPSSVEYLFLDHEKPAAVESLHVTRFNFQ